MYISAYQMNGKRIPASSVHAPFERVDRSPDAFARAVDHGGEPRLTTHVVTELMGDHAPQLRDRQHRDQRQPEHHDRPRADAHPATDVINRRVHVGNDVHVVRHVAVGRLGHRSDLFEQPRLLFGGDAWSRLGERPGSRHDPDDDRDDADRGGGQDQSRETHVGLHLERRGSMRARPRSPAPTGRSRPSGRAGALPASCARPAPPPGAHGRNHARRRSGAIAPSRRAHPLR